MAYIIVLVPRGVIGAGRAYHNAWLGQTILFCEPFPISLFLKFCCSTFLLLIKTEFFISYNVFMCSLCSYECCEKSAEMTWGSVTNPQHCLVLSEQQSLWWAQAMTEVSVEKEASHSVIPYSHLFKNQTTSLHTQLTVLQSDTDPAKQTADFPQIEPSAPTIAQRSTQHYTFI